MKLNINTIDYRGSIVDGSGIRTVLFVQGCERKCLGCHNPKTWDKRKGKEVEIEEIVKELEEKCPNKKVTISGGEPLLQYEQVMELVKKLQEYDIALYTGYELEEVPKELLEYLDYIKVGKYEKEKRTTTAQYYGSMNQRFIKLK